MTSPLELMRKMVRQGGWWYVVNLVAIVIVLLVELLPGIMVREVLNTLQIGQQKSVPWMLLGAFVGIALVRFVMYLIGTYSNVKMRIPTMNAMRFSLLSRLLQLPAVSALKGSPGEIVSRLRDDIGELPQVIVQINDILALLAFAVVSFIMMYAIAPQATLAIAIPLVMIVVGARFAYDKIYYYRTERRRATGRVIGFIAETYGSVQAVQVAGAEKLVLKHFDKLNTVREHATLREVLYDGLLGASFHSSLTIGIAIMMLMVNQSARSGSFGAGDVAFFVYNLGIISELLFEIGVFIGRQQQLKVSIQRLEYVGHDQPVSDMFSLEEPPTVTPMPPLTNVTVRGLGVEWQNGTFGIRDVDLDLAPGRLVVVTGPVGSGKTTLLRACLGMLPNVHGSIHWNGTLVEDVAERFIPPAVAYTSQVPRLFSDTLRENITQGRPSVDAHIGNAVHGAVMEFDVAQFESGVDTLVGSRGVRLSGGQVQRAAFARMLYETPQVWCIDDVSSALDIVTEQSLWQRFTDIRATVACLIVTHRPTVMQMADEIIILDHGSIVARGTYAELRGQGLLQTEK
jgi:ATP-binding cassette subfamily B protein